MTDTIWNVGGEGRGACQEEQGGRLALTEVVEGPMRGRSRSPVWAVWMGLSPHIHKETPNSSVCRVGLEGRYGDLVGAH